ncbi:MAG: hypothetical protein ABFS37_00865, partial [Acidobacteriota bacterium]
MTEIGRRPPLRETTSALTALAETLSLRAPPQECHSSRGPHRLPYRVVRVRTTGKERHLPS